MRVDKVLLFVTVHLSLCAEARRFEPCGGKTGKNVLAFLELRGRIHHVHRLLRLAKENRGLSPLAKHAQRSKHLQGKFPSGADYEYGYSGADFFFLLLLVCVYGGGAWSGSSDHESPRPRKAS